MERESTRQLKVSRQIQKDLSEIFRERGTTYFKGAMVTVTKVRITPDLSIAKAYLSFFPSNLTEEAFKIVEETTRSIRGDLGKRISKQFRIVPELQFFIDDSLDYADHIDQLLKK